MSIIDKTLKTIGLQRTKDFVPPLSSLDSSSSSQIKDYKHKADQLEANMSWVFAANDFISEAAASVPIKLYEVDRDGNKTEIAQHELIDLIEDPNMMLNGHQFKKLYFTYMNLTGESYALKLGEDPAKPDALHVFPSHKVSFEAKPDYRDSIVRYQQKTYSITEVIRDINPDPRAPLRGIGVVAAAGKAIDMDFNAQDYNRRFFSNSARPSMVVQVSGQLDDTAFERLKQEIKENYQGTNNAHGVMVLEGDAKAEPFILTQKEMDFMASRKFSKDEILAMFKLSPAMLGMTENVNRSNAEAAEVIFAKNVLVPKVRQYVDMLNHQLVKPYEKNQSGNRAKQLMFDFVNPVPEDRNFKLRRQSQGLNRWLTVNEVRELDGLEPVDGGDVLADGRATLEMNQLALKVAKMELKNALPVRSKEIQEEGKPYPQSAYNSEVMSAFAGVTNKYLDAFETDFIATTRDHFEEQRVQMIEELHSTEKFWNKAKALEIDPEDWKKLAPLLLPIYEKIMQHEGDTATLLVMGATGFDAGSPAAAKFISDRAKRISKLVDKETNKALKATLAEGVRDGDTIFELEARINDVFNFNADHRSVRIARTESVRAAGQADILAWKDTGVVTAKEWDMIDDGRQDAMCEAMDGTIIDLEKPYFEQGESLEYTDGKGNPKSVTMSFEDVNSPPIHVNCRCKLKPIVVES